MSKVKHVIRMYESGVPKKEIARRLSISKNTVKEYIKKVEEQNLSPPELLEKETPELEGMFGSSFYKDEKYVQLSSLFPYFEKELRRTGVTRQLLWHEYKTKHPEGYSYSRFSFHFAQWLKTSNASMHMEHDPGDKLYIDFAGKKLSYVNRATGEVIPVEVLVTSLGYSQLIYAQACPDLRDARPSPGYAGLLAKGHFLRMHLCIAHPGIRFSGPFRWVGLPRWGPVCRCWRR